MAWKNERQRHSMAKKGIKTNNNISKYTEKLSKTQKEIFEETCDECISVYWIIDGNKYKLKATHENENLTKVEHYGNITLEIQPQSDGSVDLEIYIPSSKYVLPPNYRTQWGDLQGEINRDLLVERIGLQPYEELWDMKFKNGTPSENKRNAQKVLRKYKKLIEKEIPIIWHWPNIKPDQDVRDMYR